MPESSSFQTVFISGELTYALDLEQVGSGLARPECVLATASGRLFVSDRRGGVQEIGPDGRQRLIGTTHLLPNGIALMRDGSFLVANLGSDGGVWRIARNGSARPYLMEVEGKPLPRVNFVALDAQERIWACISATDGGDRYPIDSKTGYIVLQDAAGARVVAEGLQYTNECRVDGAGRTLYVNETFGRRLSRFRLLPGGVLRARETVAEFGTGDFPDGLTLDAEGGAWVVCVGSNRIHRVSRDGAVETIIDDADPACVARLEAAFQTRTLTRPMLSAATGRTLKNITSLAFGGPGLRTAYLGCLAGDALATFRSPVPGFAPVHWNWS